jgi:FkbM family methyltransferase
MQNPEYISQRNISWRDIAASIKALTEPSFRVGASVTTALRRLSTLTDLLLPNAGQPKHTISLSDSVTFHVSTRQMLKAARFLKKEIFRKRRYHRDGFEIRPNDTIIDIGANMGMFTMWAAPQAPKGRVVAIEPMNVIDCLDVNVRLNEIKNVTTVNAAVGRDGDVLEFLDYPSFNIITHQVGVRPAMITRFLIRLLLFGRRVEPVPVRAPCVSLGTVMDELDLEVVDYLKIDCEGGEYEIFRTLADEHWGRIRRIAMEFHELQPGHRHNELVELLEAQGFEVEIRKPFFDYHFMKFGELWARRP